MHKSKIFQEGVSVTFFHLFQGLSGA